MLATVPALIATGELEQVMRRHLGVPSVVCSGLNGLSVFAPQHRLPHGTNETAEANV